MPVVSVIVPNYNHAQFLDRRMQSVLGQTFGDIEVVFLDDASTDDSRATFAKYVDDPRVRALFNDKNSGSPFAQWNKGVSQASGTYIWIAESDDDADPRMLEVLVAELDRHQDAVLACCDAWQIGEQGNRLWRNETCFRYVHPTHWQQDYVNDGVDEVVRYMVVTNTIPNASGVLFRREAWERVGPVPPEWKLSGDWFQWIRMLTLGDVVYVAEPLNYFRQHGNTVRASSAKGGVYVLEYYRILHYIRNRFPFDRERYEVACAKAFRDWREVEWGERHTGGGMRLARRLQILKEAVGADPRIAIRMLRHGLQAVKRRMGM